MPRLTFAVPRIAGGALAAVGIITAFVGGTSLAEDLTPEELARVKAAETRRVQTIESVEPAVVAIFGGNPARGGGSGVLVDPDGFAVTNYHVVRGAGRAGKAGLADGKLYKWRVYGMDPGGDLALIRLEGKDTFPAAPIGDSRRVRVGDWSLAMGNPFNLAVENYQPTVTLGIVSGVERFQPGERGGQTLVYGNCIQIDTSINPGNSGGPLFNMAGEVIGINGRGSFEERGRVNVGVGYAISSEQVKNFLPDLMATRLCRHATLDATFIDLDGKVICDQVKLDAAVGKAGLRPGDELVSFDGRPVETANQFLNRITTYPEAWPVSVTFRRGDAEPRTVWLRLPYLPYDPRGRRVENDDKDEAEDEDDAEESQPEKSDEDTDDKAKKAEEDKEKDQKPGDVKKIIRKVRGKRQKLKAGSIIDRKLNRAQSERLLHQLAALTADPQTRRKLTGFEVETAEVSGTLDRDGTFRPDAEPAKGPLAEAAWALAFALDAKPLEGYETVELEGGDKATGRRAFRLRAEDGDGGAVLIWLGLFGSEGEFEHRLLKAAVDTPEKGADRAWTFGDYREVGGVLLPHRVTEVTGLMEKPVAETVITEWKPLVEDTRKADPETDDEAGEGEENGS